MAFRSAPIDTLPVELLSYVFLLATHPYAYGSGSDEAVLPFNSQSIKTPLTLGLVNKCWRQVTLTTPSLWTSLCATLESIQQDNLGQTSFNVSHITSYLFLSRKYPLDIVIDARDEQWDYSEPEITSQHEHSTYVPPFNPAHIATVLTHLLPHLYRWRSIVILTDTWAPMHAGILQLNRSLDMCGAPLLESLVLMRCNEYVSHAPEFQPPLLRSPAFLSIINTTGIFPKLRTLSLHGVHADWNALHSILQSNENPTLRKLELTYLSPDVRPTLPQYCQILWACPELTQLSVLAAGPVLPEVRLSDEEEVISIPAISLPRLRELSIGYRSMSDGGKLAEMLNAPAVRKLTVEDATHPGDPFAVNSTGFLTFLATGQRQERIENLVITYLAPNPSSAFHRDTKVEIQTISRAKLPSVATSILRKPSLPFPLLEELVLNRTQASPESFQDLFRTLSDLRRLELSDVPVCALDALVPKTCRDTSSSPNIIIPCPGLQALCLRGFPYAQVQAFHSTFSTIAAMRAAAGASKVTDVEIFVGNIEGNALFEEAALLAKSCGTAVRLVEFSPLVSWDVEESEEEEDAEEDAFQLGGAFNDPLFDAFYTGTRQIVQLS